MAENTVKKCPHDCLKCSMAQQIYCTSQNTHDIAIMLAEWRGMMFGGVGKVNNSTEEGGAENRPSNEQPQNYNEQ